MRAAALVRDLEKAGLGDRAEELAKAMEAGGWRGGRLAWGWTAGPDNNRVAPIDYRIALQGIAVAVQEKVQGLILKDLVSRAHGIGATPPNARDWSSTPVRDSSPAAARQETDVYAIEMRSDTIVERELMNVESTIQWASPYSLLWILGLASGSLALLGLLRWQWGRPIAPARRVGLVIVRLLILAVVALILFNPVRVDTIPGAVERPKVVYLVDSSQSMALGTGTTRWQRVVQTIREAGAPETPG